MLLVNRTIFSLNPSGLLKLDLKWLQVKLCWWKYLLVTQTCLKLAELSASCYNVSEGSISQILNSGSKITRRSEKKLSRLCYCYKWLILSRTRKSLFIFLKYLKYLKEEVQNAKTISNLLLTQGHYPCLFFQFVVASLMALCL